MSTTKQLKLGTSIIAPRASNGGWRHPLSDSYIRNPMKYFTQVIQTAEKGKMDFVFLPDYYNVFARSENEFEKNINVWLEPVTLLSAMSAVSEKIGLSVTLSTTYNEPYHVARMMASLDHLSNGRACWNIVTSRGDSEAVNFNVEHRPQIHERDEHATLFIELVKSLWESWEPDAIIEDRESGVFALPEKIHPVQHQSKWFSVASPLNVASPPQGHPVLMQAGQSTEFRERAVKTSEVIFTQLNNMTDAKAFYKDVKERALKNGVNPAEVLVMPGVQVIVAKTEDLARQKQIDYQQFDNLASRNDRIALFIGLDMTSLSLDMPLPKHSNMRQDAKYQEVLHIAKEHQLTTIYDLYMHLEETKNHHLTLVGTAVQIADVMETWLQEGAADGFILIPHLLPVGIQDFVEEVIPELQKRGIFRSDYEGSTLREHLGLSLPPKSIHPYAYEKTT
ncbi:NtaA/DmoA family FMN-dependent monooxygenase [Metasolibacillus meyeri]|uniref:NtaA/DmoA family FMN-dependent monooxygenase n=1 Tax=Metasolibacillus meyeri TaxID=1071052 RepID=UPI000D2F7425|nr:NtaA/DmoA family FMN-dependent monooxygenase [Metasolibacillus meyeri]